MRIEPSGVVLTGVCEVRTHLCQARSPAPITAVWGLPGRTQINVCRACLEEMVRQGDWEIPGARIQQRVDAAVYAPDGELMLVVEVKSAPAAEPSKSIEWAERIHRNLVLHAGVPGAPYFLLVGYPGSLFLWRNPWQSNAFTEPDEVYFDPHLLDRVQPAGESVDESPADQERTVAAWLQEAIRDPEMFGGKPHAGWLHALFQELRGGTVMRQTPVFA